MASSFHPHQGLCSLDPRHRAKGYVPSRRYRLDRAPALAILGGGLADVSYAYAYFTALFNDVSLASTYTYSCGWPFFCMIMDQSVSWRAVGDLNPLLNFQPPVD